MLKRSCLAAGLCLATLSTPAGAQVVPYNLSYPMLEQIFVQNQQYFVIDDEGFNDPSLNHLHFTTLDTTTGAFTGTLWPPVLLPAVPQQTVPVSGTFTIHPGVSALGDATDLGDHLEIAFSWTINGICTGQQASYRARSRSSAIRAPRWGRSSPG
ncbi:MAG: hypothetical protein WDN69_16460 [Aliidongia sp.]